MQKEDTPGEMLRRIRLQRNLTLRVASDRLGVSASSLSRLERDMRVVERADVAAAIRGYQLSAWETFQLESAAKLAPTPLPKIDDEAAWRVLTEHLRVLTVPAYVVDGHNLIRAWNGQAQALLELPAQSAPMNPLEMLFSPRMRTLLGETWHETVVLACRQYYLRTLHVAGEGRLRKSVGDVARKYGSVFTEVWDKALETSREPDTASVEQINTVIKVYTPVGVIEYLLLELARHTLLSLDLHVLVPLGEQSMRRHREAVAGVNPDIVVRLRRGGAGA